MEESANIKIEVKIGALRKNLLDLTMRNKLLNFKPRAKSIRVVDEIPTEIYQLLVLEDKKLQFIPRSPMKQEKELLIIICRKNKLTSLILLRINP